MRCLSHSRPEHTSLSVMVLHGGGGVQRVLTLCPRGPNFCVVNDLILDKYLRTCAASLIYIFGARTAAEYIRHRKGWETNPKRQRLVGVINFIEIRPTEGGLRARNRFRSISDGTIFYERI